MIRFRIIHIAILFTFLPLIAFGVDLDETKGEVNYFSLQDCIDYAIINNQGVKIAELETEISQAKVGEYLSQGLPQVDANLNFNKNFTFPRSKAD